jgi:hypothetical protein
MLGMATVPSRYLALNLKNSPTWHQHGTNMARTWHTMQGKIRSKLGKIRSKLDKQSKFTKIMYNDVNCQAELLPSFGWNLFWYPLAMQGCSPEGFPGTETETFLCIYWAPFPNPELPGSPNDPNSYKI